MAVGFAEIAATVRIRGEATKELFQALAQRSFPHEYLDDVAAFPTRLADEVLAQLPGLEAAAPDQAAQEAQVRQLKRYGFLLEHVHKVAEFLESSDVLAIPASISLYLDDALARLQANGRLVLRADNDFNYSFDPLAGAINEALDSSGFTQRLPEPLALFRFPSAAKDDALLHTILAHEVGHFVDVYQGLYAQVRVAAGAPQYQEMQDNVVAGLPLDVSSTSDRLILNRAMKVFSDWIGELLSDLVGVHLLGPAFAFALLEFQGLEEDPSEGSLTHPPSVMRHHLIQEELRSLDWLDSVLKPRHLWEDAAAYNPRPIVSGWPLEKKLVELIADKIAGFFGACQQVVRNLFAGRSFTAAQFQADEPQMRPLLEHYIPPAESVRPDGAATPFSPESVMNACWLFWAEDTPGWQNGDSPYQKRLLLGRLMLKGLEVSRIRSRLQ